jgi:AraC-like DNA-binding protein
LYCTFAGWQHQHIRPPIEIALLEKETAVYAPRNRHFYELIYIQEGKGTYWVNGNTHKYHKGKIFFLIPEDKHKLLLETRTRFVSIRFSANSFQQLKNEAEQIEYCDWMKKTEYIFHNYHAKAGCLFRDKNDEIFGLALMEGMVREQERQGTGYLLIIRQSVTILFNLVARNLLMAEAADPVQKNSKPSVMKIISYLQQYIQQPDLLKMPVIAQAFNISVNYLGEYFTKNYGKSIQEYLIDYKLKLIETRLLYSDMRVNEIAAEMNFTDESHLSRIFKRHRGMTPGAWRKQQGAVAR